MARPFEGRLFEEDLPEVRDLLFGQGQNNLQPGDIQEIMSHPFAMLPGLAARARAAAMKESISYRNFTVGAAIYVTDSNLGRAAILYGANYTPFKGAPKRCAEMAVLEKADRSGYTKVHALAVSGPPQADSLSGVVSPTLHPCSECRNMLRGHPIVYPDTLLITADESGEQHEVYAMPELFRVHGSSYFDDREDLYADDIKLQEAIAAGWGDELPKMSLYQKAANLVLGKLRK